MKKIIQVDTTFTGIQPDDLEVINGSELILIGTVNRNLIIELGSSAIIHGIVNGNVSCSGRCVIYGTINGILIGENYRIQKGAIVNNIAH